MLLCSTSYLSQPLVLYPTPGRNPEWVLVLLPSIVLSVTPICSIRTGPGAITKGSSLLFAEFRRCFSHFSNPYHSRLIILNAWISLLLVTNSINGFDGTMMNGLQSIPQWQDAFNHPEGSMLGLLNAIQNIGLLAGLPFAPYLADGVGRRASPLFGAATTV